LDVADAIAAPKEQPGGEIITWGGATSVQVLSRTGLVDRYVIVTQLVAYGGGLGIFHDQLDR
jgi:dihydrofolate reductase